MRFLTKLRSRRRLSKNKILACAVSASILTAVTNTPSASADIFYGHNIGGAILDEFYGAAQANGRTPEDFFGPAVTPESIASRDGRWQAFTQPQSIYWHPLVSGGRANQIGGDIRTRWGQLGYEGGDLRYPTSRESPTRTSGFSGTAGRFNSFEGGSIYWTQPWGARVVWGEIYRQWAAQDYEHGPAGFPQGDEVQCFDGNRQPTSSHYFGFGQRFEGGWRFFNSPGSFQLPYDSVNSAKEMPFRAQTKYGEFLNAGVSFWNSLGRVDIRPQSGNDILALDIADYKDDATTTVGYYRYRGANSSGLLMFNDSYMASRPDVSRWVVKHELGHALGLEHSCQTQIMDPFVPPNAGSAGLGELDRVNYYNRWGW